MKSPTLIVSNPPHGDVDPNRAAQSLGLGVVEARMKANFRAPEIWAADGDRARMQSMSRVLRDAGLSTALLAGDALLDVPDKGKAQAIAFENDHVAITVKGADVRLPYSAELFAVFCKPPAGFHAKRRTTRSVAQGLGQASGSVVLDALSRSSRTEATPASASDPAMLDLYCVLDGAPRRIVVTEGPVQISGLSDAGTSSARIALVALVNACERRFTQIRVDRRLENIRSRRPRIVGSANASEEKRKLYSFGTDDLAQLLASISPELKEISQYDLGSRLAYLMQQSSSETSA